MDESLQSVTDSTNRLDLPPRVAQFLSKPLHVGVDGSGLERARMLPDRLEEPLPAANPSSVACEVDQELELERCEGDRLVVYRHLVPSHVDAQSFDLETIDRYLGLCTRAAQNSMQAKRQFSGAVGFRHEIVCAQLEREDPIDLVVSKGDQDHRLGSCVGALADSLEHVGRSHVGQLVLDDQDGGFLFGQEPNRSLSIGRAIEIGTGWSQRLTECLKQGVATSDNATIDCHHREELEERA